MGLFGAIETKAKKAALVRLVRQSREHATGFVAGLWAFLDGHKRAVATLYLALQKWHPEWPAWQYVDAVAVSLGWDKVAPTMDPNDLVTFGLVSGALAHWAVKGYREWKAGIPFVEIGRSPLDQTVVVERIVSGAPPPEVIVKAQDPGQAAGVPTEQIIVESVQPKASG